MQITVLMQSQCCRKLSRWNEGNSRTQRWSVTSWRRWGRDRRTGTRRRWRHAEEWPPRRGNAAPTTRQELYHCLAIVCATERRLAEPDRTFRQDDVVSQRTEPAARQEWRRQPYRQRVDRNWSDGACCRRRNDDDGSHRLWRWRCNCHIAMTVSAITVLRAWSKAYDAGSSSPCARKTVGCSGPWSSSFSVTP